MKHNITFMMKRLRCLHEIRDKKYPDYLKFIFKIYAEYDFKPEEYIIINDNINHDDDDDDDEYKTNIDKIYKKLSLLIHPDKDINNDATNFIKLQQYYNNHDLFQLSCMADEYNVDISGILPDIYIILEKKIYTLNRDIANIINADYYPFIINDKPGIEILKKNLVTFINLKKENSRLKKEMEELKIAKGLIV